MVSPSGHSRNLVVLENVEIAFPLNKLTINSVFWMCLPYIFSCWGKTIDYQVELPVIGRNTNSCIHIECYLFWKILTWIYSSFLQSQHSLKVFAWFLLEYKDNILWVLYLFKHDINRQILNTNLFSTDICRLRSSVLV